MHLTKEILQTVLEDDATPYGGKAFHNETVTDFLETVDKKPKNLNELNKLLKANGIKPLNPQTKE